MGINCGLGIVSGTRIRIAMNGGGMQEAFTREMVCPIIFTHFSKDVRLIFKDGGEGIQRREGRIARKE